MPGMNKSSRTVSLILASLARLEADDPPPTALDALGLLDEIRRLQRKWTEQVAADSPRRVDADFREMRTWYRRWLTAAHRALGRDDVPQLRRACDEVERSLEDFAFPLPEPPR